MTDKTCQNATKILFIAATEREIEAARSAFGERFDYFVSGIGGISTMLGALRAIDIYAPSFVVQIGIAGAISENISTGDVVIVSEDSTVDLGAWRVEENCFVPFHTIIYSSDFSHANYNSVVGQTVNTATTPLVHATADIETMEGAHFMAAAKSRSLNFAQIRAISNRVTDKRCDWKVDEAISALSLALKDIFKD